MFRARPSFRQADEFDRLAGDAPHGQGRTAATVAVHPGQDHAVIADCVVKVFGSVHGVLPCQAVDHQQCFARVGNVADGFDLRHQFVVDGQAARGVEHVDVVAAHGCLCFGPLGDGTGFRL